MNLLPLIRRLREIAKKRGAEHSTPEGRALVADIERRIAEIELQTAAEQG
jgi:hypothetical protein